MGVKRSSFCGPVDQYDYMGAMQFVNLFMLGLRRYHNLLDFGCGSLRFGRFAIQYLDSGNYFAIEPKKDLVDEGIKLNHLEQLIEAKNPKFRFSNDCNMAAFGTKFDFVIAQSVFTHMAKTQINRTLRFAFKTMKSTSIFLLNYRPGGGDYEGKNWTQKNIKYKPATIKGLIEKNGLKCSPVHLIHTHLQHWLMVRK